MMVGLVFDGLHNSDVGVTLSGDIQIGNPSKIKVKELLTGTNIMYDFSGVNGVQQMTERTLTAPFNIIDFDRRDYRSTHLVATRVLNWLMKPNRKVKLTIDKFPGFYFMAEVESVPDLETGVFETGEFEVEFTAYPFKIRDRIAGEDEWATFNFLTDVRQVTHTQLLPITEQLPFKLLSVGDIVNIGGWAQYFGSAGAVSRYQTAQDYTIDDIREVEDVDFSLGRFDKTQYFLREIGSWVRSQDIVQARNDFAEVELYNSGITRVIPTIEFTNIGVSTYGGITIEKDGRFYNLKGTEVNKQLVLKTGENKLKIYGQGYYLNFVWRDEVV